MNIQKSRQIGIESGILVAIQLSSIAALFWLGGFQFLRRNDLLFLFCLGGGLGVHSIWTMRRYQLSVFPEAKEQARLCRDGAYRWIRHPMYLSVILACLAPVLAVQLFISWILMGILLVVILLKIRIEERIWIRREPQRYVAYIQKTKRLIPYLY